MPFKAKLPVIALLLSAYSASAMNLATLPKEDPPAHHWPWWLRILAVIAVLIFIRIVAGSMRGGASGPRTGPTNTE